MTLKKPTYASAILTALICTVAGLLINSISWQYTAMVSTIFLALGAGGLALIFILLCVQHYFRRKG